jgi:hypothetical protein
LAGLPEYAYKHLGITFVDLPCIRPPIRVYMIKKRTRINAKPVAEIIGCSHKTVLKGGAGTAELSRIRNGTRQIRFILEEVLEFAQRQEDQASKELKRPIKK